jgi:hypothetical protein
MFETAGTLTIVELVSSLVALVLLPLLWAAAAAVAALRGTGERLAVRTAIAASGGTFGLAVAHALRAAQMPAGRVAQQHVAQLARIGQLDLSLDLVRDPTAAAFAVLVAFVAFAAVLHAVWKTERGVATRLAWTGVATTATLLVVLADGLVAIALGLQLATLAGWALAGGRGGRSLGLALAGDTAVVFAAWLLFWSLGGAFGTSGYAPDPDPRFALVAVPDAPRADGKATVALTTYEGALVSSDDGPPLPGEPLRSPFTLALDPGTYSFQIEAGAATSELLVTHVTLAPGRAYVLTPYGPTTSFRNLADQIAVPRPSATGPRSLRAALASRSIAGVRVSTVLGLVVVVATLLRLAFLARSGRGGLVFALEGVPPVVLVMHVAPLVEPGAAAGLAILPAIPAAFLAADAASSRSLTRVASAVLAALAAVATASVLLGETAGAFTVIAAATLGTACAAAAIESEADVRWLGVTCAGLAGALPGAGASSGVAASIAGAFGASAAGRWGGGVVAPLLTVAAILVALALFRLYGASIRSAGDRDGARGSRFLVPVLATASVLGGAALGIGTSPFGGQLAPLARRLVANPGGNDAVAGMATAGLGLSVAAAAIGLAAARRATRTRATPPWVTALGGPALLVAKGADAGISLLRFFVHSVVVMNEDVIDDATEVLASGFGVVGRRVVTRTGMDDPRRFERVTLVLVLAMVALLGLVVLSSVVLA